MRAFAVRSRSTTFVTTIATAIAALGFVAALPRCVTDSSDTISLDGGADAEASGAFAVSGAVDGLPAAGTVTITLNGGSPLSAGNGPFAFPASLANGQSYAVAVTASTAGYFCAVKNGMGTIAAMDATGVIVHCGLSSAQLASLSLSAAPLSPSFSPDTLSYTAQARISALFPPATTTTVTATARDPIAKITVNGAAATSGAPSAPITLAPSTSITVGVTASDGTTTASYAVAFTGLVDDYLKASNTQANGSFGRSVALSSDGSTLAIGSDGEASNATGIGGNQADTSMPGSGAVYVFHRNGGAWSQEAYVKASNTRNGASFGKSVALSADGNTLAVGSDQESSASTGIGGDQSDTSAGGAGAVYVFVRAAGAWSQQAYVKASNARTNAAFGTSVSLSNDGSSLLVGSPYESSGATGVNGNQADMSAAGSGAAYLFTRTATTWSQTAYFKASNTRASTLFGGAVTISGDATRIAVGSPGEQGTSSGINGDETMASGEPNGAVYVFALATSAWSQEAYVKATKNFTYVSAKFGAAVALSSDGSTLAAGAPFECCPNKGVNTTCNSTTLGSSGAAYVFRRMGGAWSQEAFVKASNTMQSSFFGSSIALSSDGATLGVGSPAEPSGATGIDGMQMDTSTMQAGAAYVFTRAGATWTQLAYVKASNTAAMQAFGTAASLSGDGKTLAVGAVGESSSAKGVNGDQKDTSTQAAGATYVY